MSQPSRLKQFLLFDIPYPFALTDSDRPEILPGSLGDRKRFVKLSGIHILLDGHPALKSDVVQNLSQLLEADYPLGRFAERPHGNGFREWNVLRQHLISESRVHIFQVKIRYPAVMLPQEGCGITISIRKVARVEAKLHPIRISVLQKQLNLLFIFDMRLDVRVKNQD